MKIIDKSIKDAFFPLCSMSGSQTSALFRKLENVRSTPLSEGKNVDAGLTTAKLVHIPVHWNKRMGSEGRGPRVQLLGTCHSAPAVLSTGS